MGRRGTKPAPTPLKVLRGVQESRINRSAPRHEAASSEPPPDLSDAAKAVWFRTVPELFRFDLLSKVEVDALVCFCEAVVTHRSAVDDVRENGVTLIGAQGGTIKNPACSVQVETARIVRSYAVEFGMTPAGRTSVQGPKIAVEDEGTAFFND